MTFEVNRMAPQANTSIIARYGDTEVLATVMLGAEKPMPDGGAPLTVDFLERLYAGGIVKGSRWVKREGRGTDEAILTDRMIDRSVRPLFPKDFVNEVQITVTLLSTDGQNDHDVLALNAVSAALAISNIPWKGPVAAVRVGLITTPEESYLTNPLTSEAEFSEMDTVVTSNAEGVLMIETGAKQVSEDKVLSAIEVAHTENQKIIKFILELVKEVGQDKYPYNPVVLNKDMILEIEKNHAADLSRFLDLSPEGRMDNVVVEEFKKALAEEYVSNPDKNQIPQIVEYLLKKLLRKITLEKKKRVDGRKLTDIRPITAEVGLLPRTHGSALFSRGLTQVLSIATLASPSLEQWIETAEGMTEKRYLHHYNAAPYSTGEVGRMGGGPGRREIGHGALAERALFPVIPTTEKFPYTIRVVSEVMSQNGSTSMASTCGSTLALMDAGVPISAPVAGVAMGIIAESQKNYLILSDLRGEEDFYGNMDFKVTGTEQGVTAIQLDIKLGDDFHGLSIKMIEEIFAQAREGRMEVLKKMLAVIPKSRQNVSQYAPKVMTIKIPVDKIGEVIGPGGKNIKNIIATTTAQVDIEDDGVVTVSSIKQEAVDQAVNWISGMVREVQIGEEFDGEVKRILPFGAFVEILPGKEGLVHVSKMTAGFVNNPEEVVHIGDKVKVKVMEIDDMGRLNLAMYWGPKEQMPEVGNQMSEPRREFPQARFSAKGGPASGWAGDRPPRPGGFRPRMGGGGFGAPRTGGGFGARRPGGFSRDNRSGGRRDRY